MKITPRIGGPVFLTALPLRLRLRAGEQFIR
jgi:hypothetical protein